MNLLFVDWGNAYLEEIKKLFERKGHYTFSFSEKPRNYYHDPIFDKKIVKEFEKKKIEVVFSIHFFPILSVLCEECHIFYISWCYNNKLDCLLFTKDVFLSHNIVFHTDSRIVQKLAKAGASAVYYLPWGVKEQSRCGREDFFADISLMTNVDSEAAVQYKKAQLKLKERTWGFLDGLLEAQEKIYGFNFIENVLTDQVLRELEKVCPLPALRKGFASKEERYAYEILYPEITNRETAGVKKILQNDRYINFLGGKICLYIAPRGVQDGIPAEAMEILGKGGFLLTNFQNDYLNYFEPEVDYVYYESTKDLSDKLKFYLEHEEKRKEIAENGFRKAQEMHTFAKRIDKMFQIIG